MSTWREVQGGVTAPKGFKAAGVHCGIKARRPDLALVWSAGPATVAGMFTSNRVQGAHIALCREHLSSGVARAILINSGNANACTGAQGDSDVREMATLAADRLKVAPMQVYVCSTGPIGIPMPMAKVRKGIGQVARALSRTGGHDAARAIRTTDTFGKEFALEMKLDGRKVRIGGMAKGAGMIEPNMATMLGFVTTDAAVEHGALEECLREAVGVTFNRISVDGDQSCNDTVLLLANGEAKTRPLGPKHADWPAFREAVTEVCRRLAFMIVQDGEGATKFVTVTVAGARTPEDARRAVRAVANSLLVKTSWFGRDPNWGRVIDAVGYSGADVRQDKIDIDYDAIPAVRGGVAVPGMLKDLEAVLSRKSFTLRIHLNQGDAEDTVYTCDCTLEYVRINSEYLT